MWVPIPSFEGSRWRNKERLIFDSWRVSHCLNLFFTPFIFLHLTGGKIGTIGTDNVPVIMQLAPLMGRILIINNSAVLA